MTHNRGRCPFRVIRDIFAMSASTSFSPKLLHRSEPPSSLHRKFRANLVRHDSKNMEETWPS